MGNLLFGGGEDAEEQQEQQELERWRPEATGQAFGGVKRKKVSSKSSESSDEGSGGSESGSVSSSASKLDSESSAGDKDSNADAQSEKSGGSGDEDGGSSDGDELDEDALAKREDAKRSKRIVVRMEFEPLLSLHEPLAVIMDEPAQLFAQQGRKKKAIRAEQQALEDAMAMNRGRADACAEHMREMGLDECELGDLVNVLGEEPDELRYALEQSKRFTVDDDDLVRRTLFQHILDVMESDIETLHELLQKLVSNEIDTDEEAIREAVKESWGELRLKVANEITLVEHVDIETENRMRREQEKEDRAKAKEERRRAQKRQKKKQDLQEEESSSSEEEDDGGLLSLNKEAERKALAFRRLQVQRRIEDFLKTYTRGMNLTKINAKGKRYHRRVYVDTLKKSLVVQGASGPKFYPFMSMKEVDIETRTTKEGRVETLVICAIEKGGRIVKELNLSFPDQSKANTFVNCVTLFSQALRSEKKAKQ